MTVASPSLRSSIAFGTPADRALGLAGVVVAAYLTATLWPSVVYAAAAHDARPLAAHVVALAIALAATSSHTPALRRLRDWLPLLLGPFLYVELRWLIAGMERPHADALVQTWELALFPSNPSATWAPRLPWGPLSEALHLAYVSYYALVLLPPLLLYARGKRTGYAATVLGLTVVYALCFTTYLFFPVDGPRFVTGPAAAPDGPIRTLVLHLLAAGSSRGTAFPSSHVAAAVVASLAALRYQRRVGVVAAVFTAGLTIGTVYGGFHYGVDALAGLIVGVVGWRVAVVLWRALSTPGAHTATAA